MEGKKIELKPCPFCGGKAQNYSMNYRRFVRCDVCGAETIKIINVCGEARDKAIEAWNRRADDGLSEKE